MMQENKPIKVLLVEDSLTAQELLTSIIEADPQLKVVHKVPNAEEALSYLESNQPDVLSLDINLPGMDGYTLTRKIMTTNPKPIVIISGHYSHDDVEKSFKSIEVGAVSILEKPTGPSDPEFAKKSREIVRHLKMASYLSSHSLRKSAASPPSPSYPPVQNTPARGDCEYQCIAIGGSLGGPQALHKIFSKLPPFLPLPVFVVQHISPGFSRGMADWLQGSTSMRIRMGQDGLSALPGEIYIAPDHCHMLVDAGNIIRLEAGSKDHTIQPSVGKLFQSIADSHGAKSIAILLTGMGKDGARELLSIKEKGGVTIAQNKESCVIYGMPQEAVKIGAVNYELPLEEIPKKVISLLQPKLKV